MTKLVVLEFDGSLATGFRVTLALGEEGQTARLRRKGDLPAAPELLTQLEHHWQETYRPLGAPYSRFWQGEESGLDFRIKPKRVLTKGPLKEQIETCHRSARELETALNDWLAADAFREIDRTLRQELSPQDRARVLLHTNDLSFQKLPWEEWDFLDRYPQAVPSFSPLEAKTAIELPPITSTGTVRILAILGHSGGIDVERDRALIQQLPYAEAVFLEQPTLKEISDRLWNESWDILFFAGHSETQGQQGIIHISPTESLTIEQLWYNLRRAVDRGLQLAIFNSCDGLGLSQRLDDLHIPQMILMRELVPDRVAHQFLTHFLQEFAAGESLYGAVRQARQRLHDELEREIPCASWLPVICQNPLVLPPSWEQLAGLEPEQEAKPQAAPVVVPTPEPAPRPQPRRDWRWSLIVSLLVAIAVIFIRSWGWLQPLEWWAYDTMLRSRPVELPDNRIVIVEITDRDQRLAAQQQNPVGSINDEVLYQLLTKIESYEPRVIGLYKLQNGESDAQTPELQEYLAKTRNLYGVCQLNGQPEKPSIPGSEFIPPERHGFGDILVDRDGVVRRQLLMVADTGLACHANNDLSLKLVEDYLKSDEIALSFTSKNILYSSSYSQNRAFNKFWKLERSRGFYKPNNDEVTVYQILLNYRNRESLHDVAQTLNVTDVLFTEDRQLENLFRDRIVLIGTNRDSEQTYTTIDGSSLQPLFLQAHMISQLLRGALDQRPILRLAPQLTSILWIMGNCIVGGGLILFCCRRAKIYQASTVSAHLGLTVLISRFLLVRGLILPIIPMLVGASVLYIIYFTPIVLPSVSHPSLNQSS